nr:AAA family ATPase [Pseudomonas sp. BR1R-5]
MTDTYETLLEFKKTGRLPGIKLIFPNIELRLDVAAKSGFVNIHLLVSNEDTNHLQELKRILKRLQFSAHNDRYDCTRDELIRLGKKTDSTIIDDGAALRLGATQFKVNFNELRNVIQESEWAKKNILIAVAGGAGDGTSGVRLAADTTIRQEIEKFAHIIFSSSPAQREFWLGQKEGNSPDVLLARYDGCKPCLHGSDSHSQASVGQPTDNRFSWVKGGLEFDALRQACIDPEGRAFVGEKPPHSAMPSQVITEVTIENAEWMTTPSIPLNPGLVAIVGARGSGKTALADMIAAGCDAVSDLGWASGSEISASFLARARELIGDAKVNLTWGGGSSVGRHLDGRDADHHTSFPRARYLSQQFVEELCSSHGVSDGLIAEIERVIFESHTQDAQDGAISFDELRDQHVGRYRQARGREADGISDISSRIATEHEKENQVKALTTQVQQKEKLIAGYNSDLAKLVVKGTEQQVARHTELNLAAQRVRTKIQAFTGQRRTFVSLQDEVKSMRVTQAPEMLRQAQSRHLNSGLNQGQWEEFLLTYQGDVDASLESYLRWADNHITELTGAPVPPRDPNEEYIAAGVNLEKVPLSLLTAEMTRLEALLSADKLIRDQFAALTKRIGQENITLQSSKTKLEDAQGAIARRKELQTDREEAYERVFDAIIQEQKALEELYEPLMQRLAAASGTLKKLSFTVRRIADVPSWANKAEEQLLDRRKAGPFNGRGSLVAIAQKLLKPAWETGSAEDIKNAMKNFLSLHHPDLLKHAPYGPQQQNEFRTWAKDMAQWLFSTDHITVRYEIAYDGIEIQKLSPGTRGIVLLLLYLALDDADDRPLIIDQPEENLDPKSVFDELVSLFIAAKTKRQVIMVTHNANLVINTDADQIIIATAGNHQPGVLPSISYQSGGLENAAIREAVCEILEGGEKAFRERARRLRVRLER